MKKLCIVLAIVLVFGFAGCGGSGTASAAPSASNSEYYFRDGTLVSRDVKIVITDWKVIPVGGKGNEYGERPVIAFWYDVTNLSGSDSVTPFSWLAMFTAVQDNDPNKVNELEVGMHPDAELVDDQGATIKEGGTLAGAIAYELDDMTTPVTLKATRGLAGEALGEQVFDISEYEIEDSPSSSIVSSSVTTGLHTMDFYEVSFEIDAKYPVEETDENTARIKLEDGVAFILVTREQALFDIFVKDSDSSGESSWPSMAVLALTSGLETQSFEGADLEIANRNGYSATFFVKAGDSWGNGAAIAVPGDEAGYCFMLVDTSGSDEYTSAFSHLLDTLTLQ